MECSDYLINSASLQLKSEASRSLACHVLTAVIQYRYIWILVL